MHLEKRRETELRRRKGSTLRTIIQSIWLAITAVGAYFFIEYLEGEGIISYGQFYRAGIPRAVPEWVFTAVLILVVVLVMQFVFVFAYVVASPAGRQRVDKPTARSRNDDPFTD